MCGVFQNRVALGSRNRDRRPGDRLRLLIALDDLNGKQPFANQAELQRLAGGLARNPTERVGPIAFGFDLQHVVHLLARVAGGRLPVTNAVLADLDRRDAPIRRLAAHLVDHDRRPRKRPELNRNRSVVVRSNAGHDPEPRDGHLF